MKKTLTLIAIVILAFSIVPASFVSCTDIDGDGVDSLLYPGSTLPQNTSYRNPVWEPDFELGTVFKSATNYIAIASETQWAKGITYSGPVMISSSLMNWNFNSAMAFPQNPDTVVTGTETTIYKRPDWAEGRIHSMTAGFARTIPSTSYWLFYQIGDTPAIGASCARAPQGPYIDFGKFFDNTYTGSSTLEHPFFVVIGSRFYLFYSTENGSYVQELTLRRNSMPTLKGEPILVSQAQLKDVAVFRKGDFFYLFGTVTEGESTRIHYGRSSAITGPYADREGNALTEGNGTLVIESGAQLINPFNVNGIFTDSQNNDFILYNVTDVAKPMLSSGYNRRPLMLNHLATTEDGWFEGVIKPEIGWTSPKFVN